MRQHLPSTLCLGLEAERKQDLGDRYARCKRCSGQGIVVLKGHGVSREKQNFPHGWEESVPSWETACAKVWGPGRAAGNGGSEHRDREMERLQPQVPEVLHAEARGLSLYFLDGSEPKVL